MSEVVVVTQYIIGRVSLDVKRELLFIAFFQFRRIPATGGLHALQAIGLRGVDEDQLVGGICGDPVQLPIGDLC